LNECADRQLTGRDEIRGDTRKGADRQRAKYSIIADHTT
jgi:hypothetical protein